MDEMNLERFKALSFKQKIEWFFGYYGVTTLVIIVIAIVVAIFLKSVLFPAPPADVCIQIYSDEIDADTAEMLRLKIEEESGGSVELARFDVTNAYAGQYFTIKINDKFLDIVLAPEDYKNQMVQADLVDKCEKLDGKDLYLCIPYRARTGDFLDEVIDITKKFLE